jgi:beta-phosphoglucomutase
LLTLERGLPKELHVFINEMKQKFTMEIVHAQCKPTFIHEYTLSKLKDTGYKLAVCSNSVRNTVETMMQRSALSGYLDYMISNEDVSNGKPDPEMYVRSMEYLALKPTECLIIEDNENGIKAARASGGHLLVVKEIAEVNLSNIINRISEIEGGVNL